MLSALGTLLLIFSLVLGGGGAAVAASQSSMPDDFLYPVKTWSEDVRSGLTVGVQTQLELQLDLADQRAEEMLGMLQAGEVPPAELQTRLQERIDQALQLAARQEDAAAVQATIQIRDRLQQQDQLFAGSLADPQANAILEQTRILLQDRLHLCEDGISEPQLLRDQLQIGKPEDKTSGNPDGKPEEPSVGGNPWTTGTPTPGSSYGPGSGKVTPVVDGGFGPGPGDGTCTPVGDAYGPGPQPINENGNNPVVDTGGNPEPGTGGNPEPGTGGNTDPGTGGNTDPGTGGNTDPGTGGNTDPGTGGNTDPDTGGNTDPGTGGGKGGGG